MEKINYSLCHDLHLLRLPGLYKDVVSNVDLSYRKSYYSVQIAVAASKIIYNDGTPSQSCSELRSCAAEPG